MVDGLWITSTHNNDMSFVIHILPPLKLGYVWVITSHRKQWDPFPFISFTIPDSKIHGANMGPIWGRQDPGGPHVGPMNFAYWDVGENGPSFSSHNKEDCYIVIMIVSTSINRVPYGVFI